MLSIDFGAYERFAQRNLKKFRQISSATGGEYAPEDVAGEAVLVADELATKRALTPDFDDPSFEDLLISHLYQRLVRYDETVVRYAVKLDRPVDGEDIALDDHPVLRRRVDVDTSLNDPLEALMARERAREAEPDVTPHQSRAAAYVHLLARCDNRMRLAADALRISLSYCYFRFNEAKAAASVQENLQPIVGDASFSPGPWRAFRMTAPRQWLQLSLDFGGGFLC